MYLYLTTDKLQLNQSAAATLDVQLNYSDKHQSTGAVSEGKQNTAHTTAATVDVLAAPASTTTRRLKDGTIRNKHASLATNVTVIYNANGTSYEIHKVTLQPGEMLSFMENIGWFLNQNRVDSTPPWWGLLYGCYLYGAPGDLLAMMNALQVAPTATTPTNQTTSVARISHFMVPQAITVDAIRYWSLAAVSNAYSVAIYRYSDLVRLTAQIDFNTPGTNQWAAAATGLGLSLEPNTQYFVASSVRATGTTAGVGTFTIAGAANSPQRVVLPSAAPSRLTGFGLGYVGQFAVTTGALPDPAATLAVQAAWTGGMQAYFLTAA